MGRNWSIGITFVGWSEIVISIVMLLIWLPLMLMDFLYGGAGFNTIYGIILCPLYTLTLIAGLLTLKLKPLGRKMNLVVWCVMIALVSLRGSNMLIGSSVSAAFNTLSYMTSLKVLLYPHMFPFPILPNLQLTIVVLLLIYYFLQPRVKMQFHLEPAV